MALTERVVILKFQQKRVDDGARSALKGFTKITPELQPESYAIRVCRLTAVKGFGDVGPMNRW